MLFYFIINGLSATADGAGRESADRFGCPWEKCNKKKVGGKPTFFIAVLLLFLQLEMLHIDRFHLRCSSLDRRLLEVLAGAKLTDSTGLLELSLESLQSLFDVVAFLDWNYDHDVFTTSFFFCGCKGK